MYAFILDRISVKPHPFFCRLLFFSTEALISSYSKSLVFLQMDFYMNVYLIVSVYLIVGSKSLVSLLLEVTEYPDLEVEYVCI